MATALISGSLVGNYICSEHAMLTAAAATGDGDVISLEREATCFAWQVTAAGAGSVSVTLKGTKVVPYTAAAAADWCTLATSTTTTEEIQHVTAKDSMFLKCNVGTLNAGTITSLLVAKTKTSK